MTDDPNRRNVRFTTKRTDLTQLLKEAENARRARALQFDPVMNHRVRAAASLDETLTEQIPGKVDLNVYINRVATFVQICEGAIGEMATSITTECLPTTWLSPFAVALVDVMHFVAACVGKGGQVGLRIAIRRKRGRLIAGLEVRGDYSVVAPAAATCGLVRAAAIIDNLDGRLDRGMDADRMVFGFVFDRIEG